MPLRSILLLLCCQNPKMENDLESLSNFIKATRESVMGMRNSLANLHSSTTEFHKTMGNNVKKPQQKINNPVQDPQKNVMANDDYTTQTSEQTESIIPETTEWEDGQNYRKEK